MSHFHAAEPDALLAHDLPCVGCGYNLRGLTRDAACPECGTAIAQSLSGSLLRFGDPKWLRGLAAGATWLCVGAVFGMLVTCGIGLLGTTTSTTVMQVQGQAITVTTTNSTVPNVALVLAGVLPAVMHFIGGWKLTTPTPDRAAQRDESTHRGIARKLLIVSTIWMLVHQTLLFTHDMMSTAAHVITISALAIAGVSLAVLLLYLRQLMIRVPDHGLAEQALILAWVSAAVFGLLAVLLLAMMVETTALGADVAISLLGLPLLLALVVFSVWLPVMLALCASVFRQQARLAQLDALV